MGSKLAIQSKTLWVNYIVIAAAILNEITPMLQDPQLSRTALVLAIANVVLRYFTKQPIATEKTILEEKVSPK